MSVASPLHFDILINTPLEKIWPHLTDPTLMIRWMGEPAMNLQVTTTWIVGESITIHGQQYGKFEILGKVKYFDPPHALSYTHLSSLSHLPDVESSYVTLEFKLTPVGAQTELSVHLHNFPTESIYKHLDFYWRTTVQLIRQQVENSGITTN